MQRSFVMVLAGLAATAPAHATSLTVDLDGVRAVRGTLYVSVQSREQFMQQNGTAGAVVTAPREGSHEFVFDVPPGEYAVSVWHDDNGNNRFDMSDQQMPLDGWAMTNSAALRAEPTFDQVKMPVGAQAATVRLSMAYGR